MGKHSVDKQFRTFQNCLMFTHYFFKNLKKKGSCNVLISQFYCFVAKAGQRIVGKDGAVYEVVVDPLTGKKYKK